MFTKSTIALAIVVGIATGALAATKRHINTPPTKQDSNTPSAEAQAICGIYRGNDPAARIQFNKDCETVLRNRRFNPF
jgi:hypothetical protein